MTRRDWMVSLGTATAGLSLTGFSDAEVTDATQLPLGLYGPSTDHLGHALSSGRFHPMTPGCPTDYVQPQTGPFEPRFFSAAEFDAIRRVVQLLLGEDDRPSDETSGVIEEVAEWIDLVVYSAPALQLARARMDALHETLAAAYNGTTEVDRSDLQKIFREGLKSLDEAARQRHKATNFVALKVDDQVAILNEISDTRLDKAVANPGTHFFQVIKAETIRGFYTSQIGLKELDYKGNAFYVRSPGCSTWRNRGASK